MGRCCTWEQKKRQFLENMKNSLIKCFWNDDRGSFIEMGAQLCAYVQLRQKTITWINFNIEAANQYSTYKVTIKPRKSIDAQEQND